MSDGQKTAISVFPKHSYSFFSTLVCYSTLPCGLHNYFSFSDSFEDRCSWAQTMEGFFAFFPQLTLILSRCYSPSLSLSFSVSFFCVCVCLAHIPYRRDFTGEGEFHNMICHSLFNIWCQAFCSPHQHQSSVPMSLFLPFSLLPFLLLLFSAALQSIHLFM